MVRHCCVKGCNNHWQPNTDVTYFSFPVKNESVANQWRQVVLCKGKGTLGKSSCVCSAHFIESDFTYFGPKRRLKKQAVPSIFPDPEELHFVVRLEVVKGQGLAPPVYKTHHNDVPHVLLFPNIAGENRQDKLADAIPGPARLQHHDGDQFETAMDVQTPQQREDTIGSETTLHSAVERHIRQRELQAPTVSLSRGQGYSPREYERHRNAAPDDPLLPGGAPGIRQDQPDVSPGPSQHGVSDANKDDIEVPQDSASADTAVQIKMAKALKVERNKVSAMTRKVRILQDRLRRREAKLISVTTMLKMLKRKGKCTEDLEHVLLRRFGGLNLELFRSELKNDACGKTGKRYSDKMKEFASTIYFYSPKAYMYLRTKLNLPHAATLRKIIGETTCEPGFVDGVFQFLKREALKSDFLRNVGLIVDGMSIRSQVSVDQKENSFRGHADYGKEADEMKLNYDRSQLATEMLAFQIVSYSTKFKIAIAHFFVKGVTADNQAKLIDLAIKKLHEVGVVVRSVTCDGASANMSTLEKLGCDFNIKNGKQPVTSFAHPVTGTNIYAVLDPCHMLKLCRNSFAECDLESPDGPISFKYLEELNKLQEKEGFKFANRLSRNHIKYGNKKMKVSLAAQTISSGVADAIDYLRQSGVPQFKNSEATCAFLKNFDMLFDMMNSRSAFGTGYKSPITLKNLEQFRQKFQACDKYIRELKCNGKLVTDTKRKAFAVGFLIDLHSFYGLASDLLRNIPKPLKYFLSYKCSQDHIELYFCCIRSRGGWNNNPTVLQALWAIRRLLHRNSVTASVNANCSSDESEPSSILEFRSGKRSMIVEDEDKDDSSEISDLMSRLENVNLSSNQENILYYITGYLVQQIIKKCTCSHCHDILISHKIHEHSYAAPNLTESSGFTSFVNRGKLCMPSTIASDIVKYCEKAFKAEIDIGFYGAINFKDRLTSIAIAHFSSKISTFYPPHPVIDTTNVLDNQHEIQIVKCIAAKYCKLRLNSFAKNKTLEYLGEKATMRQKLSRLIVFNNV